MSEGLQRTSSRDMNVELARLVQSVAHLGPSVNDISAHLSLYRETIRYRYKHLILDKGFTVHAVPNYGKLGLNQIIFLLAFPLSLQSSTGKILSLLHENCYVNRAEKTLTDPSYVVYASVPREHVKDCIHLFKCLESSGVFSELKAYRFEYVRRPPMMARLYDFGAGIWSYDWPKIQQRLPRVPLNNEHQEKYDEIDLLLLKEFQTDANISVQEISKKVGMKYRKLVWHHVNHLKKRGLIEGYAVNWMGAIGKGRGAGRHQAYLPISLIIEGVSEGTMLKLMGMLQNMPFLWFEASGDDYYFASLWVPVESFTEFLSRLSDSRIDAKKIRYFITTQEKTTDFGASYNLFDEKSKKWILNASVVMREFDNVLLEAEET